MSPRRADKGMNIVIEDVASHRNGISGAPFHVITFRWAEEGDEPRPMVAVLFEEKGTCAVLDREETRKGNIAFANGNSWRGDHFEPALRKAIKKYEAAIAADWKVLTTGEPIAAGEIKS